MQSIRRMALIVTACVLSAGLYAVDAPPAAWWSFDRIKDGAVLDAIGRHADTLNGFFDVAEGVSGNCLRFDGYTTGVIRNFSAAPVLPDAFTVQAWVAPQTYAWDWTAIVNQKKDRRSGFFFGIDVTGHAGLHLAVGGAWVECNSAKTIPLLKWTHLAATFDKNNGVALYINGELSGSIIIRGSMNRADGTDILIGKNQTKMAPRYCEGNGARSILSDMVFDGLIDEVKIHDTALNAEQIHRSFAEATPVQPQPLRFQALPTGPEGAGRFGAYPCRLRYSEQWDRLWRIGDTPDILVRFDERPVKYMFWHGSCYGGIWITENGRLMADQSLERAGKGKSPWGCPEHMSDKQSRYSSVRILENSDARVVIHWRYALTDIKYLIFGEDPETGWGEWAEEYYFIYPDAVSTRHQILWSKHLSHEWQETILLNQPGTYPEDNVENEALTLANLQGETQSFSWIENRKEMTLKDPILQMSNLKSRFRPFLVLQPRAGVRVMPGSDFAKRGTHYLWWNHWPVAQIPSDGTKAYAPDKPSHTSLSQTIENSPVVLHQKGKRDFSDAQNTGIVHDPEKNTFSAVHLTGLTDSPITGLLPLSRSWNFPAEMKLAAEAFTSEGYDKVQRAYVLNCIRSGRPSELRMQLAASPDSLLVNPAFVINGWGEADVRLAVDGREIERGKDFRIGRRLRVGATDLVVWIRMHATKAVNLSLIP